jgi:very-short-patch-repair endonuclease
MTTRTTAFAMALRKKSTDVENLLWNKLRGKQVEGLKFRRQQAIDHYIVDFVCLQKRVIIELDGGQHALEGCKDSERDNSLRKNGFEVVRFWDNEVLQNIEGVLEVIRSKCLDHPPLNPLPSREGEEKR